LEAKTIRLQDKIAGLREQMRNLDQIREQLKTQPDRQLSLTDPDARSMATSGTCRNGHGISHLMLSASAA
jgi:hypothetical protein